MAATRAPRRVGERREGEEVETFYTYMWLRKDGTPYYVGKGSGNRAFTKHRNNGLRPPPDRNRIIVQERPSKEAAVEAEKSLIAHYGRKDNGTGILRNMTDGGIGSSGRIRWPKYTPKTYDCEKAEWENPNKFPGLGQKPITNIVGQKFGRLTVKQFVGHRRYPSGAYETRWLCVCACGKELEVGRNNLRTTKSCGCWHLENAKTLHLTHGQSRRGRMTPEYRSYSHAKARCENPTDHKYPYYGARGIEFRFVSFQEWYTELGGKPEPKRRYSVHRIDNDKHYEKGNVKWATGKEQMSNRRGWGAVSRGRANAAD